MRKEKELKKFPKRTKFKKSHRGTMSLIDFNPKSLIFRKGRFAIRTMSAGFIKWKTLMETQKILKRILKKKKSKIKIWINLSLDWPISRKPKGTRMGKGKGKVNFDDWVTRVRAGKNIIEISNAPFSLISKAISLAIRVLPMPCVFVKRI